MPETTIDEYSDLFSREEHVRLALNYRIYPVSSYILAPYIFSEQKFRFSVFASDPGHIVASLFLRNLIHRKLISPLANGPICCP